MINPVIIDVEYRSCGCITWSLAYSTVKAPHEQHPLAIVFAVERKIVDKL